MKWQIEMTTAFTFVISYSHINYTNEIVIQKEKNVFVE